MAEGVFRGFLSILGGQVGILLVSIVVTPLLTRILGSASYGDYAFLISTLSLVLIVVNAGIYDGARKYISENREYEYWESDVFSFYAWLATALALVAVLTVLIAVYTGVVTYVFGPEFDRYFALLAALVVTKQFSKLVRSGLMGIGYEHYAEPLRVVERLLFGSIAVSLAYVGFGVTGVMFGYVISTLTIVLVAFLLLASRLDYVRVFSLSWSDLPTFELLSFNFLSVVLLFLTSSLYHVDLILLRPLVGSDQAGYYKVALVAAEFLWLVPFSLQLVLLHSTSEMWSDEERDRISRIASDATRFGLLLTTLLAIGLAALADPFLPMYFGSEYDAAVTPLLLLLPGVLGFALARPIFAIGQGKGDLRVLINATGVAALLNLVLNLVLIPRYGMNGAAVATSIGYSSMFVLHTWSARSIGFDPLSDLRIGRIAVTALLAGLVIFGLARLVTHDVLALIVVPPIGLLVYSALALKTRAIEPEEVRDVLGRLSPP